MSVLLHGLLPKVYFFLLSFVYRSGILPFILPSFSSLPHNFALIHYIKTINSNTISALFKFNSTLNTFFAVPVCVCVCKCDFYHIFCNTTPTLHVLTNLCKLRCECTCVCIVLFSCLILIESIPLLSSYFRSKF